jgi:hypothetical protein
VAFPADFVYRDSRCSTANFYGRGFGYSRSLNASLRSASEEQGIAGFGLDELRRFDLVLVGSFSRNRALTSKVLKAVEPSRLVLIHGEDTPPLNRDYRLLVESGAHVFVRSIYR